MKKLALAIVLAATGVVNAVAADLPVKAPPPAPVPAISWTGIYIGPHIGYAWTDAHYLTNHVNGAVGNVCANSNFITPCDPVSSNPAGLVVGGQVGGRWQTGAWVFGVEGSWTSVNLNQTTNSVALPNPGGISYYTALRDVYTATGQVGYAWNGALAYVKGGYAGGRFNLNSFFPGGPPQAVTPATATGNGWTVGGGVEYSLTSNFSIGVEYNHIHLDAGSVAVCSPPGSGLVFDCTLPAGVFAGQFKYANIQDNIDQVLFRANYRFNWLAGPLVAKY